jgi:hypothetical protein
MRAMPPFTVGILGKSGLGAAAKGIVAILRRRKRFPRRHVNILGTILLATLPAPALATSFSCLKGVCMIETTGENIVTGGVF